MSEFNADDDLNAMAEINMTPLVDIMLVLLIIFMITLPAMTHAVKIDLPRAGDQPSREVAKPVTVTIDAEGRIYWDGENVDQAGLDSRIRMSAHLNPVPELHLRADRKAAYEQVAKVLAAAQSGGLKKIGFITDPKAL